MQREDYFDFLQPDDIRIKGHRIGIETVLYEYLHRNRCPEEIQSLFPSLTLEEVYATVLYYLHDPKTVGQYVADWLAWSQQARKTQAQNPPSAVRRLQAIRAEIEAAPSKEREMIRQRIIEREKAARAGTPERCKN